MRASKAHEIETSASFPEAAASSLCQRDLIEACGTVLSSSPSLSFFLGKREGHASADTLINGLRHAIPRDPFEKLRTIDLARFRNEGYTLTSSLPASLSPCTERGNDANAASVCPLAERKRGDNEKRETAEWDDRRGKRFG